MNNVLTFPVTVAGSHRLHCNRKYLIKLNEYKRDIISYSADLVTRMESDEARELSNEIEGLYEEINHICRRYLMWDEEQLEDFIDEVKEAIMDNPLYITAVKEMRDY